MHVPSNLKRLQQADDEPVHKDNQRRAPSVSVMAYRDDLRGAIGTGSQTKINFLRRFKSFRAWKRVLVEGAPLGTKDAVFFAPDNCLSTSRDARGTPTSFVNIDPRKSKHTVYRGDPFEITFLGMSVTPQDTMSGNNNELLLYSLTRNSDPLAPDAIRAAASALSQGATTGHTLRGSDFGPELIKENGMHAPKSAVPLFNNPSLSSSSQHYSVPTGVSSVTGDVPFIHYDPVIDGHDLGNAPGTYVPVPATKALYQRCLGKEAANGNVGVPQSVSLRFTIMEIDKVSDLQARAVPNVDQLGNYVSSSAESIPYLELLTRAFTVANSLGRSGLKKYAKPNHVHSVDMEFLLADPDVGDNAPICGNYLQYGYYFFLSDKVDAKLYAQTCSSSQSVPLLLKREGFTKRMENRNEKEYFPLSGVSYLVAKVTRGCKHVDNTKIPELRMEHKRRLDNMLQMSNVIELLAAMHNKSNVPSARLERSMQ